MRKSYLPSLLLLLSFFCIFTIAESSAQTIKYEVETDVQTNVTIENQSDFSELNNSVEHIKNFTTGIKINPDATVEVREEITFDFAKSERHGIFRYIPYTKENIEGKKFEYDIDVKRVTDQGGAPYKYTLTRENEQVMIKIGDPDTLITGAHTYVIVYTVRGVITYFSDHDELYWNVTGNQWSEPILQTSAAVTLPAHIDQSSFLPKCYIGRYGNVEGNCTYTYDQSILTITPERPLAADEGFTIAILFPKNVVAVVEPREIVDWWTTPGGKLAATMIAAAIGIVAFLWYILYPLWLPLRWWLYGRDPRSGTGQVRAWYDPPKTKKGRSLTPAETGALVDEHVHTRDIMAAIVDLARRGYLTIIEKKKGEFHFEKRKEFATDTSLQPFEVILLTELFADSNKTSLKGRNFYDEAERIKEELYQSLVSDGFFPEHPENIRKFYNIISGVALFTLNLPLVVFALIFGRNMARKTLLGVQGAVIGRSLKNFLTSQEQQLTFQAKQQMFFEKLLPYAIAFGVEKVWVDRFKDIKMTAPEWYQGYAGTHFTYSSFSNSMRSSVNSFEKAATPTRSSSGFSSGGSGFSGGGFGGGGGGSW